MATDGTERVERIGTDVLVQGRFAPGWAEVRRPDGPADRPGGHGEGGDAAVEIVLGDPPSDAAPGIVCPPLVNAHTHLGDAALAPLELSGTIEEVFAPPDGLKHRHLRELSRTDAIDGMASAIGTMARTGTRRFLDFREGGMDGVALLEEAVARARTRGADGVDAAGPDARGGATARPPVEACILGRPADLAHDPDEVDALLDRCPGLGLSALRDFPDGVAEAIADHVHARGGRLALHASEAVREPIGPVLDLGPDLLVHLCQATPDDLAAVADAGVPVAVCPRSNARFGLEAPLPGLLEAGASVHLGTDNAMFQPPDLLAEAAFSLDAFPELEAAAVLAMAASDPFGSDPFAEKAVGRGGFADEGPVEAAIHIPTKSADPSKALRAGAVGPVQWLP